MSAPTPTLAASLARATARYGKNIVQRGAQHVVPLRAHPTHLPDIDALTSYGGLPAGAITLLRGHGSAASCASR